MGIYILCPQPSFYTVRRFVHAPALRPVCKQEYKLQLSQGIQEEGSEKVERMEAEIAMLRDKLNTQQVCRPFAIPTAALMGTTGPVVCFQ